MFKQEEHDNICVYIYIYASHMKVTIFIELYCVCSKTCLRYVNVLERRHIK